MSFGWGLMPLCFARKRLISITYMPQSQEFACWGQSIIAFSVGAEPGESNGPWCRMSCSERVAYSPSSPAPSPFSHLILKRMTEQWESWQTALNHNATIRCSNVCKREETWTKKRNINKHPILSFIFHTNDFHQLPLPNLICYSLEWIPTVSIEAVHLAELVSVRLHLLFRKQR
jgi:hypothetical protein